jgi:nucleoid-associated protein YgaU
MEKYKRVTLILVLSVVVFGGCAATLSEDKRLSNQGFQEISWGNYRQAEVLLDRALSLNPNNPYALLNMGVVYQNTGRIEKARQMYSKVVTLNPKDTADRSNIDSAAGKPLLEIAIENLKVLEKQEAAVVVPVKKPAQESPLASLAQEKIQPAHEEEVSAVSKIATLEKKVEKEAGLPTVVPRPEKQSVAKVKKGYYTVQKGDSLLKIAGRTEVYDDPLKWPSLFRLNMDRLGGMEVEEAFQHKEITEGPDLRFVTSLEAIENLTELGQKLWVVNVLSAQSSTSIVPSAIRLIKNGYNVYIIKAKVNEKEWIRLRVGFFKDYSEAAKEGKKMMPMLNITGEPWVVKIADREYNEFGGY